MPPTTTTTTTTNTTNPSRNRKFWRTLAKPLLRRLGRSGAHPPRAWRHLNDDSADVFTVRHAPDRPRSAVPPEDAPTEERPRLDFNFFGRGESDQDDESSGNEAWSGDEEDQRPLAYGRGGIPILSYSARHTYPYGGVIGPQDPLGFVQAHLPWDSINESSSWNSHGRVDEANCSAGEAAMEAEDEIWGSWRRGDNDSETSSVTHLLAPHQGPPETHERGRCLTCRHTGNECLCGHAQHKTALAGIMKTARRGYIHARGKRLVEDVESQDETDQEAHAEDSDTDSDGPDEADANTPPTPPFSEHITSALPALTALIEHPEAASLRGIRPPRSAMDHIAALMSTEAGRAYLHDDVVRVGTVARTPVLVPVSPHVSRLREFRAYHGWVGREQTGTGAQPVLDVISEH